MLKEKLNKGLQEAPDDSRYIWQILYSSYATPTATIMYSDEELAHSGRLNRKIEGIVAWR
jgi:hypothetical protein